MVFYWIDTMNDGFKISVNKSLNGLVARNFTNIDDIKLI